MKHFETPLETVRKCECPSKDDGSYFRSQLLEDFTRLKRVKLSGAGSAGCSGKQA